MCTVCGLYIMPVKAKAQEIHVFHFFPSSDYFLANCYYSTPCEPLYPSAQTFHSQVLSQLDTNMIMIFYRVLLCFICL